MSNHSSSSPQAITTQRTSKPLKAQLLISTFLFWFGLLSYFLPHGHTSEVLGLPWSAVVMIIGGTWYMITKVMVWWQHG
jgi:hypothetical protein